MRESYWGYWLIVLGIFVVVILLLIRNVTSNNTEDYYTLNQISEAAMVDAVDFAYYRQFGELKINKEQSDKADDHADYLVPRQALFIYKKADKNKNHRERAALNKRGGAY